MYSSNVYDTLRATNRSNILMRAEMLAELSSAEEYVDVRFYRHAGEDRVCVDLLPAAPYSFEGTFEEALKWLAENIQKEHANQCL